jgi:hypothetical protein
MVPSPSHPRYRQLVKGEFTHKFKQFTAGMCVSRNQRKVAMDNSPQATAEAVKDIHEFFQKFEGILEEDLKAIFG